MLQDFVGGAKGILVVVGLAALLALGGYILFDFDARTPRSGEDAGRQMAP